MRIVRLTAENFKRLRAVEITPTGDVVVIAGRNAAGKQQPVSEPVLTPTGWVTMGDLRVGDYVMGSSGAPTRVLGVYPQEERRTFAVRMVDGGVVRCGPDHLWTVHRLKSVRKGSAARLAGSKTSVLIAETLTTTQLLTRGILAQGGRCRRFSVALPLPLQFVDTGRELPIDPYALGVILGDGHIESTGYVTVTSYDPEILAALKTDGWQGENGTVLGTAEWSRPIVHLGLAGCLSWQKFIPPVYFLGSIEDRWSLLCGLLDTDGTAAGSWAEFCTTSERLARGVADLALSLGCLASVRASGTKRYRYKGELKQGRDAWLVRIKSAEAPFRLARKRAKWKVAVLRPVPRRFIVDITEVEPEDSVCIRVEADDGLYVTNDYVLTHNTSVLDAIYVTLAGGAAARDTTRPVREGEEHAFVDLDLGRLRVTRRWDANGKTSLRVTAADGAKYGSPQTMLDGLVGALSFDPLSFANLPEKEQFATLLRLVDLPFDPAEMDRRRRGLFDERTDVGREVKQLEGQLGGMPKPTPGLPEEEVSVAGLLTEYREAQDAHARHAAVEGERARLEAEVARLRAELDAAERALADLPSADEPANLPDLAGYEERLATVEETNGRVRAARERAAVETRLAERRAAQDELTGRIAALDGEKAEALQNAVMPIQGLGFDEDGVTYLGLPFAQASAAERLRVSVAMAMALNPEIRVIRITDGSLLDRENMRLIAEMAGERDYQVWIERVSDGEEVGVVIEDGAVVDAAGATS